MRVPGSRRPAQQTAEKPKPDVTKPENSKKPADLLRHGEFFRSLFSPRGALSPAVRQVE